MNTRPQKYTVAQIPARYITYLHTVCASSAFLVALVVGCYTHYHKIVQNEYFGYPEEWFPSVSATTGDRYPARALFQILIALTAGPRFALVLLWYVCSNQSSKTLLSIGLIRNIACGGWVFITSTDDHRIHNIAMIIYVLCTLPWQLGVLYTSPKNHISVKRRKYLTTLFFGTLPPMIYYFVQHKIHRIPGAYTTYAFFEWSLIIYDIAFDAVTSLDFEKFDVKVTRRKTDEWQKEKEIV
ncbi:Frag1/DRAM/Sfk1 [Mucor mucedo]|uniref:Frag1/DRAM/Sfk1 n=1 Tax=Mucor mucedo TaxID=29922 RepID=UPI00221EC875|nr:Frag1/DRAM/Sfk1 [Mucor mucedo]KAI7890408.1 Frag1/DRAM/Sfk1 [Mucor mucedo]